MLERTPSGTDERTFAQWRDETVAHFETLATRCEARDQVAHNPDQQRRAQALRKLARTLRAEKA